MTTRRAFFLSFALGTAVVGAGCERHSDHDDHAHDVDGHDDHDDHDDAGDPWRLTLTDEQVREAGIATVAAGPGVLADVLTATAIVGDNLDAQAHVTPRLEGLVRAIHASLGDRVSGGAPLCDVDSIELGAAASETIAAAARLDASRKALDRARETLDRGVALADEILRRERDLADRELTTLRTVLEAETALGQARADRDLRLLDLQAELDQGRIHRDAALRRLSILGVDPALLDDPAVGPDLRKGRYRVLAPRDGVIVERDATLNESVDAEHVLFRIQDLARAWVQASVYEHDLVNVRIGAPALVRLNAFPGHEFAGSVAFIDYHVDPATRAARVRVELDNGPIARWPEPYPIRPGMFGEVDFTVAEREAPVVIPEAAIVHEEDGPRVFVAEGERAYAGRHVTISQAAGHLVEVHDGIAAGDEVVVAGTFLLKSMARAGELGGGHSH